MNPTIFRRWFVGMITAIWLFLPFSGAAAELVKKPFYLGADISALAAPESHGNHLRTYQENGRTNDELTLLLNHGWNAFRLRVFVSPVRKAPDNSLENTVPLARRIKAANALFLLDLHFSDTWADPQHQDIPVAWANLDLDGLAAQWESHASNVVARLKAAGAMPDWVQVGNEITFGAAWPVAKLPWERATGSHPARPCEDPQQWEHLTRLLQAGIRGVKAGAGDTPPQIVIHLDKGGNGKITRWFFDHLAAAHVDYDLIGESFYPPWKHGTLEQLQDNLVQCARRYHKDFVVVETGYRWPRSTNNPDLLWPETPAGRLQYMADIINTVRPAPRGRGVFYWAPEWELWNRDGTPEPAISVLNQINTLTNRPASHAPPPAAGPED